MQNIAQELRSVTVGDATIEQIIYKGQAIVTLSMIAANQATIKHTGVNALETMGLQTKHRDHNDDLYYEITEAGEEYAKALDTGKKHNSGTPVVQIKWYSDVVELIQDYMQEKLAA